MVESAVQRYEAHGKILTKNRGENCKLCKHNKIRYYINMFETTTWMIYHIYHVPISYTYCTYIYILYECIYIYTYICIIPYIKLQLKCHNFSPAARHLRPMFISTYRIPSVRNEERFGGSSVGAVPLNLDFLNLISWVESDGPTTPIPLRK